MKKLLLALILLLPTFLNVQAKTKQENIKILFHLMQTDSVLDKTMKNMLPVLMKSMPTPQAPDAQLQANMDKMTKMVIDITNRLMNEDMVAIYDKYYTETEIEQLVAFYESKTGQKMVAISPELNKEMLSIMMTKYLPEIQKMTQK